MVQSTVSPAETVRNHPDTEIVAKMNPALKEKWVAALRSGEFEQERGGIGNVERKSLCCLGVGAVAVNPAIDLWCTDDAVEELSKHGFAGYSGTDLEDYSAVIRLLVDMNDLQGADFQKIADYIEQNL